MTTKDSSYLTNRLQQLRLDAMNRHQGDKTEVIKSPPATHLQDRAPILQEKPVSTFENKKASKVTFQEQGQAFFNQINSLQEASTGLGAQNFVEPKRAPSMQLKGNLKHPDPVVTGSKIITETFQNGHDFVMESPYVLQTESKPRTVYASNHHDYDFKMSHTLQPSQIITAEKNANTPYFKQNPEIKQSTFQSTFGANTNAFTEKTENKLYGDLQQRYSTQLEKNSKLSEEIMTSQRNLENEKMKLKQLQDQCQEEFLHSKNMEAEANHNFETLKENLDSIIQKDDIEEERRVTLQSDLEKTQIENEMLRGELKRLGEITSEKILDLENNINSVGRMRELEQENATMEREKVTSSAEFVIEQMRVHFADQNAKIEEQTRKLPAEIDRLGMDVHALREELRMFNSNADQKINITMNAIIQEEQEKQQAERREAELRLNFEEEEVRRINKLNQDLVQRLQKSERDGKNKLIGKKNENTRLKEELSNYETNYNKLLIQVGNENREYERKKDALEVLKDEHEEMNGRVHILEQKFSEEMQTMQIGQEESLQASERDYKRLKEREEKLIQAIQEEKDRLMHLQKQYDGIVDQIQHTFDNALQNQFSRVGH